METGTIFNMNSYGAKAEEDMVNARAVIPSTIGTPRAGIFWCEQAIEKYFKHIIATKHDRSAEVLIGQHRLLTLCRDAGFSCSEGERLWLRELTSMYYERYPVINGEPEPKNPDWDDARTVLTLAEKVRTWAVSVVRRRESGLKKSLNNMDLLGSD